MFIVSPSAPYYFKYVVGNMLHYATFSTATNIAGIVGVIVGPLFLATIAKNNLKGTLIGFILIIIACHICILFTGTNMWAFIILLTVAQFFYQGIAAILFTAFVNGCDVVELRNRKAGNNDVASGTAMSLHFTAVMFAQVLAGYIRNWALARAGFQGANTVASPELTHGLLNLYAWLPAFFLAIALVAVMFYNLTPEKMKEVHAELDPMREASNKAS